LQVPLLQLAGATQSPFVPQLVRQAVGPHTYFPQELLAVTQLPIPSQLEVSRVVPLQVDAAQDVPAA
jgi:hypothetical protein